MEDPRHDACPVCGDYCAAYAAELLREAAYDEWWEATEPPLAVYHAEMAAWFVELHPEEVAA